MNAREALQKLVDALGSGTGRPTAPILMALHDARNVLSVPEGGMVRPLKLSKYDPLTRVDIREGIDVWFTLPDPVPYLNAHVDHDGTKDNSVRVFRNSPESMALQIRTMGPTCHRGKPRAVFSHFSSNRQNMLTLAAEIIRIAHTLPEV